MNILRKITNSRSDEDEEFYSAIKKMTRFQTEKYPSFTKRLLHTVL